MKRLLLCAAVALAASLVLVPAAFASVGAHHSDVNARPLGLASHARVFAPVGDATTYDISGHVLDFAGDPVQGAEVDWGFWSDAAGGYTAGGTNYPADTGADGAFAFTDISGGHTYGGNPSDELDVYYNPPATEYALEAMIQWSLDFATNNDATPYSYEVQPAQANITLANYPYTWAEVRAGNDNEGYARADVLLTGDAGVASVLPSTSFDDVSAYMYLSGYSDADYVMCPFNIESLVAPMSVSAGATAVSTIPLDGDNAQWAYFAGPLCRHSGAAGRTLTMVLQDWPVNETAGFQGWYGADLDNAYNYSTTKTSSSATATYNVPLKVYAHAPVGVYEVDAYSTTSLADMWDLYQVTTCKASASSIYLGHAVRLSGKVPGSGTATLYSVTKKATSQPASLTPSWHKVGSYKISSGKFVTPYLHPKRTTWYVVKYKGYAFWAYTQIVKVRVH
jgi:hypothetical protein